MLVVGVLVVVVVVVVRGGGGGGGGGGVGTGAALVIFFGVRILASEAGVKGASTNSSALPKYAAVLCCALKCVHEVILSRCVRLQWFVVCR